MTIIKSTGAGDPASTGFFTHTIDQSLRFDGSSSYLYFTPSSAATDSSKITFSTWVKTWGFGISDGYILSAGSSYIDGVGYNPNHKFTSIRNGGVGGGSATGNGVRRDPSAWYHLYVIYDADAGHNKIYVNGVLDGVASTSSDLAKLGVNGQVQRIMRKSNGSTYLDLYLAETHFVDGSSYGPDTFGETVDGVWVPKQVSGVSYGNNGWYLDYADSSDIGKDVSGRGNHWTSSGLAASDVVLDSPTNNFGTMNPLDKNSMTVSEGNLKVVPSGDYKAIRGNFGIPTSGKWYFEARILTPGGGNVQDNQVGIVTASNVLSGSSPYPQAFTYGVGYLGLGQINRGGSAAQSSLTAFTAGKVLGVAVNVDDDEVQFYLDGSTVGTAEQLVSTTEPNFPFYVGATSRGVTFNFGQDSTFAGAVSAGGNSDSQGIGDFAYAPPSGHLALCASNLPDITIGPGQSSQADSFFETMLYVGNGAEQHIGSGGAQHPQDTISITNSLRFEAGSSAYLSRTQGSSPTNIGKWTVNFWLKRTNVLAATDDYDTVFGVDGPGNTAFTFLGGKIYLFVNYNTSGSQARLITNREFLNTATFYNFHITFDRTASTASERLRLYVNGVEETSFSTDERSSIASDSSSGWNVGSLSAAINRRAGGQDSRYHNGYIAQFYNIDGAVVAPTEFAQVGSSGHWIPKTYTGSYGNNGWLLEFKQTGTGSGATNTVGADTSGNNNHWDSSGIAAEDVTIDSPTQNFSVMNPNRYSGIGNFSEGNLKVTTTTNNRSTYGTIAVPSSGKWYYEVRVDSYASGGGAYFGWGTDTSRGDNEYGSTTGIHFSSYNEQVLLDGSGQSGGYGSNGTDVASNGDVYSVLLDVDNGLFYYAKNGTYFNSANPSNGTGGLSVADIIIDAVTEIRPSLTRGGSYSEQYLFNFGQDPSFNGGETAPGTDKTDANGVGKFLYDVPTGFLALMDDNIPQEGIESPDWVWIKSRAATRHHMLYDSVRGATKAIRSSLTNAEVTGSTTLTSFDGQGFTVGSDSDVNTSTEAFVAWTWKAGGEPTVDNSAGNGATPTAGSVKIDGNNLGSALAGSLAATRLSANTTAGFSIVIWDASGVSSGTMAHGLTAAPDLIIAKNRNHGTNWFVQVPDFLANTHILNLETTSAAFNPGINHFNDTVPTDEVFSFGGYLGGHSDVGSNTQMIAYCFHNVEGYSKVGTYLGNGSTDGTFVFLGFRPAFILIKNTSASSSWYIFDSARNTYNEMDKYLRPHISNAEGTLDFCDFTSNGFKIRSSASEWNGSGNTIIVLAFAEAPFKFANAR